MGKILLATVGCFFVLACAASMVTVKPTLHAPAVVPRVRSFEDPSANFADVKKRWTTGGKVSGILSATVKATHWDWSVYESLLAKRTDERYYNDEDIEKEFNQFRKEYEDYITFTIEFKSNVSSVLGGDKESIFYDWRYLLFNDQGQRLEPVNVEKGKIDVSSTFLPGSQWVPPSYSYEYSRSDEVVFPREHATGQTPFISGATRFIKLIITGQPGRVELTWEFEK